MRGAPHIVVALLLWAGPAAADKAKADALDAAGKAAFAKGEYADSVVAFRAAFDEEPRPALLFNLAKAQQKLGDFGGAIETLDRYLDEAPKASDRNEIEAFQAFLRGKLEATKVRLTIRTSPGGALLRLDSQTGPTDHTTPWSGWVEPGRYKLALTKPGHEEVEHEFVVELGKERSLELRLSPVTEAAQAKPVTAPAPAPRASAPAARTSAWPYVALGAAIVAGAGAAWAGLSSRTAVEDAARARDQAGYASAMDQADRSAALATGLGVAAGVALAASAALFYVEF